MPSTMTKVAFHPHAGITIHKYETLGSCCKKKKPILFQLPHVDGLYTLCKYRLSDKINVKSEQLFDNWQRANQFDHKNRGVDRMPSRAKKRSLRKKVKKRLLSSFQKTKSKQTSGSVFTV